MTELLEAVATDVSGPDETECPFDCGRTCKAQNNFQRAEKFWNNMQTGVSTVNFYQKDDGNFIHKPLKLTPVFRPRDLPHLENYWGWGAHHLIPVATLRDHPIRKYLDKDNEVSCDVGYEVNGVQNGQWLLASYGKTGMQAALKDPVVKSMVEDAMRRAGIQGSSKVSNYSILSGDAKERETNDRLGFKQLMFDTMREYNCQFHDSHVPYGTFVEGVLNKIDANLLQLKKSCLSAGKCKDASKKPMAPHMLVLRLNNVSSRLRNYVTGPATSWVKPLFTSTFAEMYAAEEQSKKKA